MWSSLKDGVRRAEAVPQVVWSLDDAFSRLLKGGLAAGLWDFGMCRAFGLASGSEGAGFRALWLWGSGSACFLA